MEAHVTGKAEVCCPADRVSLRVSLSSSKESVDEVTKSVSRRLEYVLQTVRQHGINDKDISVRKFLRREADDYRMDTEIVVNFFNFETMETVCSVLLEKLDKSVCVGTPHFYHSATCLSNLRRRACVSAVEEAKEKAHEVSYSLGKLLGPPILVKEEETKEWKNKEEEDGGRGQSTTTLPHFPRVPTITISSRVSVSFSLREKTR